MTGGVAFLSTGMMPDRSADEIDELGVGGDDDFGVALQRCLHGLQLAEELGVSDEILLSRFVDKLDGLGFALRSQNLRLSDTLGLLDLRALLPVCGCLRGRGEVDGGDLFVFGP